jgi:hypothetical protein
MSKEVGINLSQQELNDLYYCVEMVCRKELNDVFKKRLDLLSDKIGEEVYKLAKEQQLEEDKLRHEMNFKRAFVRHGDY